MCDHWLCASAGHTSRRVLAKASHDVRYTCAQCRWCGCRPGPERYQLRCRPHARATSTAPPAAHPALRAGPHPVWAPQPSLTQKPPSPCFGRECGGSTGNTQTLIVPVGTIMAFALLQLQQTHVRSADLHQLHDQQQHRLTVRRSSSAVHLHQVGVPADPLRRLHLCVTQHMIAGRPVLCSRRATVACGWPWQLCQSGGHPQNA